MNKTIKRKWVKALRSGEYKQGYEELKCDYADGGYKYCCLGVLCEVMGEKNIKGHVMPEPSILVRAGIDFDEYEPVDENAKCTANKLAHFNDSGKSFDWIASYIERYL